MACTAAPAVRSDPLGEVATFKHLPPTLMPQGHFTDLGAFKPYVGAGVNCTKIWGENMTALGQPVARDPWLLSVDVGDRL